MMVTFHRFIQYILVAEKYHQTSSSDDGNNPNRMLSRPESDEDSDIEGHWWGN